MTDGKRPTAGFWITVTLIAVLVAYPLSWGPAIFFYQICGRPAWMELPLTVYTPLVWLLNSGRPWYLEPYRRYVFWFMLEDG